jgi:hypothetical protein
MIEIYDKTFVKTMQLGPANIKDKCKGGPLIVNAFTLAIVRSFHEWWWKKPGELQQPGPGR